MSRESKTSVNKKPSKSPSRTESTQNPMVNDDDSQALLRSAGRKQDSPDLDGIEPLPPTPPERATLGNPSTLGSTTSGTLVKVPSEGPKEKQKKKNNEPSHTPKRGGGETPRGGRNGSRSHRGGMKFGERPSRLRDSMMDLETNQVDDEHIAPSTIQRMTAVYFHKDNDLSRSARGVGYSPNQAVSQYGPGVTGEAENLYGPCRLLTDFKYSTWTETVVPLRNHNVVQGFNEMILFLIKLAANPDGPVNHEEAFMATSFLANIRNDLGEHPPNVLALLEYIDFKTFDDGTEPANPDVEVMTPCKAAERY